MEPNSKFFKDKVEARGYMVKFRERNPKRQCHLYEIKESAAMERTEEKLKFDPENPHATKYRYVTTAYITTGWLVSHPREKKNFYG